MIASNWPSPGQPRPVSRFAPFAHATHVYGVAELAQRVQALLQTDPALQDVWVRGEISGVSRSPAGHHYFNLKDVGGPGQLRAVLFRGSAFNSPVAPANGVAVVAHGALQLYERLGAVELVADLLFPEGVGLEQLRAELVYRRLEADGLFEPSRKRSLPTFPRRIGLISSEQGAAMHDVLSVLGRRFPLAEVLFVPCPVQGQGAAEALRRAVQRLGHWTRAGQALDVIVLARGGGSPDDLAAFNDEDLARAIFACPVPVVSAVGHETNLTLADLVADVRAATPSAAAELVAPSIDALRHELETLESRGAAAMARQLAEAQRATQASQARFVRAARLRLAEAHQRLEAEHARLRALSPAATLRRGYAIARQAGQPLRDAAQVQPGSRLQIQLSRGQLTGTVDSVELDA